jgi:hypothetical protein
MKAIISIAGIVMASATFTLAEPALAQAKSIQGKDGSTWWKCADEGKRCDIQGELKVAFGVQGKWKYRLVRHSIACTSKAFGGDPAVGVEKACYYMSETELRPRAPIDSSWRLCAPEGKRCNFEGERRVAFGTGNRWSYRFGINGIDCTNQRFGDPAAGQVKSCYIDPNY